MLQDLAAASDGRVPLVLTQKWLVGRLPADVGHVIRLDADWEQIAQEWRQKTWVTEAGQPTTWRT